VVRDYYRQCQALIFPGEEDFGIVPLEAQACGRPVIAFAKGGALETVISLDRCTAAEDDGLEPTGVFFDESTPDALCAAVSLFQQRVAEFAPEASRRNAIRFDRPAFIERIKVFLIDRMGLSII
jgi:glycosyltransferase involved in cell wall biosynthesis